MANNLSLKVNDISRVTLELFQKAYFLAYENGITSLAPLGFSGDNIILFGESEKGNRVSQISLRNYGNDVELLITDINGRFIFYGRYHVSMGVEFIVNEYYKIFKRSKKYIEGELPERPDFANLDIPQNVSTTKGWDMLASYQSFLQK